MAKIYADLIRKGRKTIDDVPGRKTIDDVPEHLRAEVQAILDGDGGAESDS